jgi:hypothetical protein
MSSQRMQTEWGGAHSGEVDSLKKAVFWVVAACSSCVNRRFGKSYRFHLQGRRIYEQGDCSVCSYLFALVPRFEQAALYHNFSL